MTAPQEPATADMLYDDSADGGGKVSSDILARNIIRGIYDGKYVPGQRLVEQDLVEEYSVSRSTVREAIKLLKADGIVSTPPFKGAQIRKLSRQEALNILSVIEVIIGLTARQAAENIAAPGAREMLDRALEKLVASASDDSKFDFVRQRNHFYNTLIKISGNSELYGIMQKLQVHLIRNRLVVPRAERVAGYTEIAERVSKGDSAGAEERARRYARRTADLLLPLF